MQTERNLLRLLLAASAIFYLIFIFRTSFDIHGQRAFTLVDDAMISMRYARNLAQGHGLVWNIGQPPVEGFTNLGWVLVMTPVHVVPFSPTTVSLVVMTIAAVILLANTAVVFQIVETLNPSARFAPLIAATMAAFYFPLVFWTLRGLEVGALTLTLSLGLLLAFRITRDPFDFASQMSAGMSQDKPHLAAIFWLTLVLSLSLLLRMDAALPVALVLIYIGVTLRDRSDRRVSSLIIPTLVVFFAFIAILLFQKTYFGDFLPNTYYLKVYGVTPWERIRVGLLVLNDYASRDFLMPLVFALIGLAAFKDLRSREAFLLLFLFLAQVSYSVWVGGDYAEELVDSANRFIAQGMPTLFILFAIVFERFLANSLAPRSPLPTKGQGIGVRTAFALAIGIGCLLVISGEPWNNWIIKNAPMLRTDTQRAKLGLHIKEYTDPSAVIAVHAAGQIPYFSERTTIDLLGKSDPVIAKGPPATSFAPGHNKWNYEYSILQLRPDVIADNFNRFSAFIDDVADYQRLPNGIYVRADSTRINIVNLSLDYQ